MNFSFFKNKADLPRNGQSAIETYGSEYLSWNQLERADVLRNIAKEYGCKLLPGFDFESILVVRKNIPQSEIELVERALEKSEADFSIEYLKNKSYPLLIFTLSIPTINASVLPLQFAIDVTDADFQDFVQHLPASFEVSIFWFDEESNHKFIITTGITGDDFVKKVATTYKSATIAYWKISEDVRSFANAVHEFLGAQK